MYHQMVVTGCQVIPAAMGATGELPVFIVDVPQFSRTGLGVQPALDPVIEMGLNGGIGQIVRQMLEKGGFSDLRGFGQFPEGGYLGKTQVSVSGDTLTGDSVETNGTDFGINRTGFLPKFPACSIQGSFSRLNVAAGNLPGCSVLMPGKDPLPPVTGTDHCVFQF